MVKRSWNRKEGIDWILSRIGLRPESLTRTQGNFSLERREGNKMLWKRVKFLFVAASVLSVVLFAGGNGMAADTCGPDFSRLSLVTLSKAGIVTEVVESSYYIKFLGVSEVVLQGKTYYKWRYQTQNSSGVQINISVSNIQFLVPANNSCDFPNEYLSVGGGTANILLPGSWNNSNEGNPYWRFVYERRILKENSDDSSSPGQNIYGFITKTLSTPKPMSLYIKGGGGDYVTQTLGPSFPVETPVIETSCQQIRKNSIPPTCLHVCYEKGGAQELVSARLYKNADCSGTTFTDLKIFDPSKKVNPDPSMLICNPCGMDGAPACPVETNPAVLPFSLQQNGYWVKCDTFRKEYETNGFTAEIGEDPCFMLNKRYTCY